MDRTSTQWVKRFISCTIPLSLLAPAMVQQAKAVVPVHIVFYEDLVKGKVTDEKGQPLPGVTVKLKQNSKAVQTDGEGNFSIAVQPGEQVLIFSFIGFKTQEITVTSGREANVTLETDATHLSDVTVFGYYAKEKRGVTQAAAKMNASQLQVPVNNFDLLMSGRMAGVQVIAGSGLVGEAPAVRVRGASSISATSSSYPLVVIDGVPVNAGNTSALITYNPLNGLSAINPADIESIQVLKDAAAAALYGSRGAAGVILVTTKRGRPGASNITYHGDLGLVQPGNQVDVLNAAQYNMTINGIRANAGLTPLAAYGKNDDGSDRVVDTDWQDVLYRDGVVQQHQLSFSGGAEKYDYYGSGTYYNYDSYLRNNSLQRATGRLNASAQVKEWLRAGLNMQFARSYQSGISRVGGTHVNAIPRSFFTYFPNVWLHNADGSYYHGRGGNAAPLGTSIYPNPLATLEQNFEFQEVRKFLGNMYLEAKPVDGLTLRSQFNTDLTNSTENHFWHPKTPDGTAFNGLNNNGFGTYNTWSWYTTAQYERYFGDHHASLLAGMEFTRRKARAIRPFGYGIKDGTFQYLSQENYTTFGADGRFDYNDGLASYFAALNYDFRDKYFVTANMRLDYNSAFIGRNQRGLFPALSAGWRLTEEGFLENNRVLSELKLRGSYGVTGNSNIGYFPAAAMYQYANYADSSVLTISTPGNAALRWEKSRQLDFGAEASLWDGALNVTADWYVKNTKDLILANPVLSTVGMPGNMLLQNIGKLRTQGVELTLQAAPFRKGKWRWQSDFNISYSKNNVLATNRNGDQVAEGVSIARPGEELGTYNLLRFHGVDPTSGRAIFLNKDGDQRMYNPATASWTDPLTGQAATAITGADKVPLSGKTPYPKWQGGFYNTVSYGQFDFTLGLQYALDFYVYNQTLATLMDNSSAYNKSTEILKAWSKAGDRAAYPATYWNDAQSWQESSLWLEKGNYVRVKEMTLGYNVPGNWLRRAKIDRVRLYIQAQNPFLFTNYKGIDPEANANGNVNIGMGIDSFRPYIAKTWMAGVHISL
ncbi:SusC/RagA family TonB-linked outer membrane protein [Chitinophaga horti]|uniref:SusC/RagA family TonB-linked outer membrane protein n=1 Tax=Chitinophaga horti TaxID=2920382 RepID=A0ABY6JAG5_9BACT|nr:SusC/RagA family TonB-linked outer membrane protein [Chitinophaga horti]UYQ95169.1 SusC/RagA family TonB-linked outer membrane protein [Chitinophaga horti]